jgi:hypothetical protein
MNDVDADEGSADPQDAEFERLRRLAFGRTTTNAEEAAAADARLRLAELEAREAERVAAQEARTAEAAARAQREERVRVEAEEELAHPLANEPADEPGDDDRPPRWRAWLLPAAVGLVVGALIAGGVAWAVRPGPAAPAAESPTPSSSGGVEYFLGDPPTSEELPPGNTEAAQGWFEPVQTEDDLVGVPELRPEFDRGTVRLVHSSPTARVWVAKQTDGSLCLETTETASQITSGSCVASDQFSERALLVSSNVLTAVWTGEQLSVVFTRR